MAGNPNKHAHYAGEGRLDWETSFKERMNELRARLRSVEVAVLRLSPLRWGQVVEVLMAIWAHTTLRGETEAAMVRIIETSGITSKQFYSGLAAAKELGLIEATRRYRTGGPTGRLSDRLRVNKAAIDELVASSRRELTRSDGVQRDLTRSDGNQRELMTAKRTQYPRTRAGASLELPINLSSAAASAREPGPDEGEQNGARPAAAAAEDFLRSEWQKAIPIANRLLKVLAPQGLRTASSELREWIAKVAMLAVRFGPQWIEPAFERLRHAPARSPQGLVAAILDDECQRLGTRLNRELARVELPQEVLPCESV